MITPRHGADLVEHDLRRMRDTMTAILAVNLYVASLPWYHRWWWMARWWVTRRLRTVTL